ncbi:hypothetical protein [Cyanobium sp. PCC 7001]|uniref:hypothetical protein n=1 Tax=Cyanobium sp. PCC 7001 TaxID=180281 RepID=UPI0018DAF7B0|nr:hypothetical protein [Cyanobium sp. PCC 7001]
MGITYNTVLADLKKVAREKMEEVYDSGYITEKKVEYVGTLDSLISGLTRTMHQMVSSGQGGRAAPIANQIIRAVRTSAEIVGVLDQNLQVEVNDCRSNDLADLLGGGIPAAMGSAQVQQSSVVDVTPVESAQLPSSDAGDSRDGQ